MRWTMQVCTQACGNVASIASGNPFRPVDATDQHVLDAAPPQVVEDRQPELGALRLLPPDPEYFAVAVDRDGQGQIAGEVAPSGPREPSRAGRRSRRSDRPRPAAGCATPRRRPS